jgi:plastocyanin
MKVINAGERRKHGALTAVLVVSVLLGVGVCLSSQPSSWRSGIAKVSVRSNLERAPGTGFVVEVKNQTAFLLTSAHVVVGDASPHVDFVVDSYRSYTATVRAIEPDDERGLALLTVANPPADITVLNDRTKLPQLGEVVNIAGFSAAIGSFSQLETALAALKGRDLYLARETDEGFSGGPVLQDGAIVGIIYGRAAGFGRALGANSIRPFLEGNNVTWRSAGANRPTVAPPTPGVAVAAASISGTVTFAGMIPSLKPYAMDADPACAQKHSAPVPSEMLLLGSGNTMGNIMVYVSKGIPAGKTYPAPNTPVVLDQIGCQYKPHVMGIMAGQPYKILNSDGVLHNVHALPKINQAFNKPMPATVTEATVTFDKPESTFQIKCDIHPWMSAYVGVFNHPFFSVTSTDGKFMISGLDAGTYEITAWHERLGTQTASVTVAASDKKTQDFKFAMPAAK